MSLIDFNQSDRCVNFSCPERSVSPKVYSLLYGFGAATVLLTVCGNLLIIISVFHFKQLHTPTNMLVLSLAVSDFLVGFTGMLFMLIWIIESCWIFGTVLCNSFLLIAGFLTTQSIYNIALIAVDRYLALSNPFFYTNTISSKTMCIVVYFNWGMCLTYNSAWYYFNGIFFTSVLCPGECFFSMNDQLFVTDVVLTFIFPLSVIIILYTRVFVIAKKHATAIRELNNHTWSKTQRITSLSMKSERKAAKVLGILVSVFLVFLLPYYIYSLLGYVVELHLKTFQKVMLVFYVNSTVNPVIYALFYPWFRRCVKIIITLQIFLTDSSLMSVLL